MTHSVLRHLRVETDAYDAAIRRFIPSYETMIGTAVDVVARARPARILDLGAGTGALSAALLERTDEGVIELWDVDGSMLARARARLAPHAARTRFVERSFLEPLPPCDAVMASLSLHHIPTLEGKAAVYRSIFTALRSGGVLVVADATLPADPEARAAVRRGWADHLVRSGIPDARAWQHFGEWDEEDTYFPLEAELDLLREVGFAASSPWSDAPSTVWVGRRP